MHCSFGLFGDLESTTRCFICEHALIALVTIKMLFSAHAKRDFFDARYVEIRRTSSVTMSNQVFFVL